METNNLGHFISVYEKFAQAEAKSDRTIEAVIGAARKFDSFLEVILDRRLNHLLS